MIQEFEIDSQLAPNDAVVALLRRVDPPRRIRLIPFRKPNHEFEGEVGPESFRIMRVGKLAHRNHLVIIGNISPKGTGTRISILVRPAIPFVALLVIIALIYLVLVVGWIVTSAPKERPDWFFFFAFPLITLANVAFSFEFLGSLGRIETRKVLPILEEVFQGKAAFSQAHQGSKVIRTRKAFGGSVVEVERRFRVPLMWYGEAVGLVSVVLGIVSLVLFFRPPKTSVMGPGQVDSRFLSIGVALIIIGVVIAWEALVILRSERIDRP